MQEFQHIYFVRRVVKMSCNTQSTSRGRCRAKFSYLEGGSNSWAILANNKKRHRLHSNHNQHFLFTHSLRVFQKGREHMPLIDLLSFWALAQTQYPIPTHTHSWTDFFIPSQETRLLARQIFSVITALHLMQCGPNSQNFICNQGAIMFSL